jgi:DNA invertase Pin-like site-specific DNA recombinase
MGRPPKLTPHQRKEAIKRRERGEESLTEIGRSYNVSAATISRLTTEAMKAARRGEVTTVGSPGKLLKSLNAGNR